MKCYESGHLVVADAPDRGHSSRFALTECPTCGELVAAIPRKSGKGIQDVYADHNRKTAWGLP